MAIDSIAASTPHKFKGLSTDTKPTQNVLAMSLFIETDTGDVYEYSGTSWTKISISGATLVSDKDEASIIDDTTTAGTTYFYYAPPGTLSSAAAWKGFKIVGATGIKTWADGNTNYDNVADDRASKSYS